MTMPYLSLKTAKGKPVLVVDYRSRRQQYPATKKGLREAGRDLYQNKCPSWLYSSSCDFPREYGCRLDVRELVQEGFDTKREETRAVGGACEVKMFKWCDEVKFLATLTPDERQYFERMRVEVEKLEADTITSE